MKKLILYKTFYFSTLILICSSANASYYGRFISGGFFSKEVFRNSTTDRYNDVAVFSERLFVNFDKIAGTNHEFTVDIRDKENLFDRLDKQRLQLTGKNKLKMYQFNVRNTDTNEGVNYTAGRFPIPEAGSASVDGLDVGFKRVMFGYNSKFSMFYGLNPNLVESEQITIDTNSKIYGGYFSLEDKSRDWDKYFYSSTALVKQVYKTEVDRFYLFNNTNIQSPNNQNFSSILYLDLDPKIYVQNLWMTYVIDFMVKYKLRTTASTIDSLHYERIQDVRETLPSSRYNQGTMSLRSTATYNSPSFESKLTYGMREVDKKFKLEYKFGTYFPKILHDEFSGTFDAGLRKNFTSNDVLLGAMLINATKLSEMSLRQDFQLEKRQNLPLNFVLITEGSYTRFFKKSLFGIISLQNTYDRNVSIFSALFKLSYRFGEGGQAPIRDGAAPMGQL